MIGRISSAHGVGANCGICVAELEIDAVEEGALGGIRNHEQATDLGAVGQKFAIAGTANGRYRTGSTSGIYAVGKLRRPLQAVVGGESAGNSGRLPHRRKVEMLLVGELPDFRDIGVVDLDLVVDLVDGESRDQAAMRIPAETLARRAQKYQHTIFRHHSERRSNLADA